MAQTLPNEFTQCFIDEKNNNIDVHVKNLLCSSFFQESDDVLCLILVQFNSKDRFYNVLSAIVVKGICVGFLHFLWRVTKCTFH